jgi:replication factor A1
MSLDDHAEELASDLGVDREEVYADLEKLVSYSVPVDEAKQSLRRKYGGGDGGGGGGGGQPTAVDVGDITTEDSSVTVTARVLTVGKRSIRYQGDEQVIHEGELADATGKISYTAWEDFGLSAGDTVTAGNAGVREWEGKPELNLGQSTNVAFEDEPLEVPYEIGGEATLAALEPGDRGVALEVRVLEVERRTIDGRDGETEILSGVLADETTRLPFTDWDPHAELGEGNSARIENAYVREFRGVPSVNVSEFSTVTALDRAVEVSDSAPRMAVGEAVATGGQYDVEVVGNVLSVRDGSGLIQRCPECGRVVQKGQCRSHGEVDAVDDLRTKAILDDGTGTVTAVLDADLTSEVYGGGLEDALEHAREEMDQGVVADTIGETIVGHEYRVRGSLSVDDYGANLDATEFERVAEPAADRAASLLAEVER